MSESVNQLIGRIIGPPANAPAPPPSGVRAFTTEPLEVLIGRILAAPGALGGPIVAPSSPPPPLDAEPPSP